MGTPSIKSLYRRHRIPWFGRFVGILFCVTILVACDDHRNATARRMPGEMQELCEKDAGVRIHDRPGNVRGYAVLPIDVTAEDIAKGDLVSVDEVGDCFPCLRELAMGYDYVETYFIAAKDRDSKIRGVRVDSSWMDRHRYVQETGLYRYRLVERADNRDACSRFDEILSLALEYPDNRSQSFLGGDPFLGNFSRAWAVTESIIRDKCVVAEPVMKFSAPYEIVRKRIDMPKGIFSLYRGKIVKFHDKIISSTDQVLVAESIVYVHVKHDAGLASCGVPLPPVNEILIPAR